MYFYSRGSFCYEQSPQPSLALPWIERGIWSSRLGCTESHGKMPSTDRFLRVSSEWGKVPMAQNLVSSLIPIWLPWKPLAILSRIHLPCQVDYNKDRKFGFNIVRIKYFH